MKGPYVVLTACAQSHPFEDRRCRVGPEDDPLKIGRSVARLKPAPDNAIFECKVLSRNHAVLWYENGDFFLRDTKSSNGTFVNKERLGNGEDSEPRQLFSGDIVQFGVEIVENTNKVAHGCIYAMVRLFDECGAEVAAPNGLPAMGTVKEKFDGHIDDPYTTNSVVASHQLFQLQQYIKESAHRERQREQKIAQLETLLEQAEEALTNSWSALVTEDRLLSKIETLEAQLALYSRNAHVDKVKQDMEQLVLERERTEAAHLENLRLALEEKKEAKLRLDDCERSLLSTEEQCLTLRDKSDDLEKKLAETVQMYVQQQETVVKLTRILEESERRLAALDKEPPQQENEKEKLLSSLIALLTNEDTDKDKGSHEREMLVELSRLLASRCAPSYPDEPEAPRLNGYEKELSPVLVAHEHSTRESESPSVLEEANSSSGNEVELLKTELNEEREENERLKERIRLLEERLEVATRSSPDASRQAAILDAAIARRNQPDVVTALLLSIAPFIAILILAFVEPILSRFAVSESKEE